MKWRVFFDSDFRVHDNVIKSIILTALKIAPATHTVPHTLSCIVAPRVVLLAANKKEALNSTMPMPTKNRAGNNMSRNVTSCRCMNAGS